MKCIVVNADDLGYSSGVNQGIVVAHQQGVLTSASLMVDMPASRDGARLARELPALSVGMHASLTDVAGQPLVGLETGEGCRDVLQQQLDRFHDLMGRLPTHLDSHHNVHRKPRLLPHFLELAARYEMPLREHSPVRHLSSFYGQWGGRTHLEQIDAQGMVRLLEKEISDGVTELGCHPGYCDPQLRSGYREEREVELRTLCHPAVRDCLSVRQIRLVNFVEAMALLAGTHEKG